MGKVSQIVGLLARHSNTYPNENSGFEYENSPAKSSGLLLGTLTH